jgi:DNA-binding transcriptional LysR family regulator
MKDLWIKYFLAVVDNDMNFTKAAQAVYVSQPALSKHINDLGKELGVKLFDTSRKNTTKLTAGGKLLYQFFTEYNDKLTKTVIAAKSLNEQETGELKIAVANDWDIFELHKKIDVFNSKYPNISISIDSMGFDGIKKGLIMYSYDMVITAWNTFGGIPNLNSKNIFSGSRILLFSSNHRLAKKTKLDITDFKDDPLCTFSSDVEPLAKMINEQYCKSKGFIPKIKTFPNLNSILLAIEAGQGFTIVNKWNRIIKNNNFKYFELDDSFIISAVWRKDNNNPALPLFCGECLEEKSVWCQSPSGQLPQALPGKAVGGPFRKGAGALALVKGNGGFVPVEACPFQPSAVPLHGDLRHKGKEQLPQPPAPEFGVYKKVLNVEPRPSREG